MAYICSCFFWFTETCKKNWWKITCHADILVELHTCRRARHKSPICSDIHQVDGSNPEEGHTPSDRLAHRTNRQSILSEKKHRLYKEKCLHRWFFIALFEPRPRWTPSRYVSFFTWQALYFSGFVTNVVRVWMLRGRYLTGLLLPFGNVSKWRVEAIIYLTKMYNKNYTYRFDTIYPNGSKSKICGYYW